LSLQTTTNMETMQWSEISISSLPSSPLRSDGGGGVIGSSDQNFHSGITENGGSLGAVAPTIKNHSVTYFNDHLYCFGGYDGRRNHNLLLLYSIRQHRWIRPRLIRNSSCVNVIDQGTVNDCRRESSFDVEEDSNSNSNNSNEGNNDSSNNNERDAVHDPQQGVNDMHTRLEQIRTHDDHQREGVYSNHPYNNYPSRNNDVFYSGGGYTITGNPPPGRNGHSATLAVDGDDNDEQDVTGRIIILGGWLGQGPLAASDMHVLEISRGGHHLRWYQPEVKGIPPGPCNMHSADYVKARKEVFVFRGGNGRQYLNDVHALHVPTMTWRKVSTTGEGPQQRANHSSCILEETGELFVFGGWNGTTRLNDIHILNTDTCNWTCPKINGVLPYPRAGMTFTALRGRLYLFGGSGTSSKCFQDLHILDRDGPSWSWLDVTQYETVPHTNSNSSNNHHHHHHHHHRNGYETIHPSYHQTNQFPLPPLILSSQHYYNTIHQHPYHEHRHQIHTLANQQDNGYHPLPPNPQWNFGGGGFYDYDAHPQNCYSNNHISNNNSNSDGTYSGTEMSCNYYQQHDRNSNNSRTGRFTSFTSSRGRDWTSRELAARPRSFGTVVASPNPNDENDTALTVLLQGIPPNSRAGHTATAVNCKIYVFGGSCGSDYLNDFYVLDTDPPPRAVVTEATSSHLIEKRLKYFFNDEEFSDVTFLVQGRKVYGHKMVLAIVSDCYRAMFTAGFRESSSSEIEITGCSYDAFLAVMEYIYTGVNPNFEIPGTSTSMVESTNSTNSSRLGRIVDILELADRYFLDHLKQVCETQLRSNIKTDTVEYILQVAQKTNAMQLQAICEHYIRNQI